MRDRVHIVWGEDDSHDLAPDRILAVCNSAADAEQFIEDWAEARSYEADKEGLKKRLYIEDFKVIGCA